MALVRSKIKSDLNNEDNIYRTAASVYFKAQAREFQPGHELDDWLAKAQKSSNKEKSRVRARVKHVCLVR